MRSEAVLKQEQIIEAAIRRFAHFGVGKTTMTEIADDLAITKQALFYYVPDKQSLIKAVEDKIVDEYISTLEKSFSQAANTEQALYKLIEIKKAFFEKYLMLLVQAETVEAANSRNAVTEGKSKVRQREVQMLAQLLAAGVERGELKPMHTENISGLLLQILSAFEHCVIHKITVPDQKNFQALFHKQKEVLQLVLNGLKRDTWKN